MSADLIEMIIVGGAITVSLPVFVSIGRRLFSARLDEGAAPATTNA